jgi:hypothetical protein
VIQVAGAAEYPGADVLVETRGQRPDCQPHRGDGLLDRERLVRPAGAEGEEHVPAWFGSQRRHRAGQEQLGARDRVRRVGHDHVEGAGQSRRQWLAQVVPHEFHLRPGRRCLPGDPVEHVGVGVDDGEPPDDGRPAQPGGEPGHRHRDQVVVAQQEDPLPGQRAGLVQPQHPADLRGHGAVRLVELGPGARLAVGRLLQPPRQAVQLGRYDHTAAAAGRARRPQRGPAADGLDCLPTV